MRYLLIIITISCCWSCQQSSKLAETTNTQSPNVLFIAIDDLRPELGCYGHQIVKSPNIDRLAAISTVFDRAYCNVPVCGASRASLLTGLRPQRDRYTNYNTRISEDMPGAMTIPSYFKEQGYHTVGLGKIGHFRDDNIEQYSEAPWRPDFPYEEEIQIDWFDYKSEENQALTEITANRRAYPYESVDGADSIYFDGIIANKAIDYIDQLSNQEQPFFLAVGFLKPHLPFNAPKKYWDLYHRDDIQLPDNYYIPQNAPKYSIHNNGELRQYYGVPESGKVTDEMARTMIHGYYACISYVDALVGQLIEALDKAGTLDNTIVVLWGDHGWNLGEHTMWCKHCNYETSLRVPLIVHALGQTAPNRSTALVEYVDLFPTLAELASLDTPVGLDGLSFVPVISEENSAPKSAVFARWKDAETIITSDYLYTVWFDDDGQQYADMLYDHKVDPDENVNVAGLEEYDDVIVELRGKLDEQMGN